MLLAAFVGVTGCGTVGPPAIEILIQQGHGSGPEELRVWRDSAKLWLESADGPDRRLWFIDEGRLKLLRRWNNVQGRWATGRGDEELLLIATTTATELYRIGRWARPVLDRSGGLPSRPKRVRAISPAKGSPGTWRAIAVEDRRGWWLFHTADGVRWEKLELDGLEPPFNGAAPIAGLLAVRDARGLSFHERAADGWRPRPLPGLARPASRLIEVLDGVIAVRPAGETGWSVYERRSGAWHPLNDALEHPVAELLEVGAPGTGLLSLRRAHQGKQDWETALQVTTGDQWTHFLRVAGRFVRVVDLDWTPKKITSARTLAQGQIVEVREKDDADGDKRIGETTWRLRSGDGWHPLAKHLPGAPSDVFDVVSFYGGKGLGVQAAAAGFPWRWYLRDGERWRPAADLLDGLPSDTYRVDSRGALLTAWAGTGRRWYVAGAGGGWTPLKTLTQPADRVRRAAAHLDAVVIDVTRRGERVRLFRYRSNDGRWSELPGGARASRRDGRPDATRVPFPAVEVPSELPGSTVITLREQGDADDDGVPGEVRPIERLGAEWRVVDAGRLAVGAGDRLRYDAQADVFVRRPAKKTGRRAFYRRDRSGRWTDASTGVPRAPKHVRAAYRFAGGAGVAIQDLRDSDGDGEWGEWHFYLRGPGGVWRPLSAQIPGAFSSIQTVHDAGNGGLGIQELGDADHNRSPGDWAWFVLHDKAWRAVASVFPGAPPGISKMVRPAPGLLGVRDDGDSDTDGAFDEWHWALRVGAGWRPIDDVVKDAPTSIMAIQSLWNGSGLSMTVPHGTLSRQGRRVATATRRVIFVREAGAWRPLALPGAPAGQILGVRADTAGRILALRTKDAGWRAWIRSEPSAGWQSLTARFPAAPSTARDARIDDDKGYIGLRVASGWRWWDVRNMEGLGASATDAWLGFESDRRPGGKMAIRGAHQVLDGRRVSAVPIPRVWLHREPGATSGGNAFHIPELVPHGLDVFAPGATGPLLVYRRDGRRFAAAFTAGTVHREVRRLTDGRSEVELLVNVFDDGVQRISRMDAPERTIWAWSSDPAVARAGGAGARVYYDDRGYFYSESDELTDAVSFRLGERVHTFDQLEAHLFRPDMLEERLGLPEGSLFQLTRRDVRRIRDARSLAPDGVDVARLRPPGLTVGAHPRTVDRCRVTLPVVAEGAGVVRASVTARVLGAGQARGARTAGRTEGDDWRRLDGIELEVALLPGPNQIVVTVVDAARLTRSRRVEVTCTQRPGKEDLWVAVIAIGDYDARLEPLPMTQSDAATVRALMRTQAKRRFRQVHVRSWCQTDGCDARPTRRVLEKGVAAFFSKARHGDQLLVYVSGHGLRAAGEYRFVPADGQPSDPGTLVSWGQIRGWMLRSGKLGKKLVVLDTCQSGSAIPDDERNKRRLVQQAAERDGIYMLTAAAPSAQAFEAPELGNGLFTHVFARALQGEADTSPADGRITFEELSRFVAERVRELSSRRGKGRRQEPFYPLLDGALDYTLAIVRRRTPVHLSVRDARTSLDATGPVLAAWRRRLTTAIEPLWLVEPDRAAYRLTVVLHPGDKTVLHLTAARGSAAGRWETASADELKAALRELAKALSPPAKK